MKIVYVEGNIGAGKSSLLRELAAAGHCVVQEPVEDWAEHLKLVYRDPLRLPMQCLLSTRIERLLKTLGASASDGTVYVERSMRSAQIFADLDPVDDAYQIIHEHYAKLVDDL
jgi:deoxyadenosine/deoxycytidine kinase